MMRQLSIVAVHLPEESRLMNDVLFLGFLCALVGREEPFKFFLQKSGVFPVCQPHEPHNGQVPRTRFFLQSQFDLIGERQEEQVRRPNAVDGGDERHGNAASQLGRVGQIP
jgi:hypothetical protein